MYGSLISAVRKLEQELEFVSHDKFGWLTICPSTVGTTLNCHVRLKLNKPTEYLSEIGEQFHLVWTNVVGISCAENECIIDISNRRVFGLSEFDCMKTVYYGVKEIIRRNSSECHTDIPAETDDEIPACDEPQAEISLNSVQSNGTYTKEQVDCENVAAPDEPAVEADDTETPNPPGEVVEEGDAGLKQSPTPDNAEVADENIEPNEDIAAVDD